MKYTVRKLQGGGLATFTPILDQTPAAAVKPQKTEESSESVLDDKLYAKLVGEGLINDVNLFVTEMEKLQNDPYNLSSPDGTTSYLRTIAKLNSLHRNKQNYIKAIQKADDSGGLDEVAVDSRRNVYYKEDGKVRSMNLDNYKKSSKQPHLLTVSALMTEREMNPQLAMNSSIFDVASTAIGVKEIADKIMDMTSLMQEFSTTTESHVSKRQIEQQIKALTNGSTPSIEQAQSFQALNNLSPQDLLKIRNTPGEFFKITNSASKNGKDIKKSLNYMWSTLSRAEQIKLDAKSASEGYSTPKEYIFNMLSDYEGLHSDFKISPEADPSGLGKGTSQDNKKSLTPFQLFHREMAADPVSSFAYNDTELGVMFRGTLGSEGPLLSENNDSIPMTTLWSVMKDFGYDRIVDGNKIFFGDKKVDTYNRPNIIYDGGTVAKTYMPVGADGAPDYKEFKNFKKIYSEYEANKDNMNTQQAEKFFSEHGYRLQIDQAGGEKVIRDNAFIKPYLVMYGYTNDATDLIEDNGEVKKLSSGEKNKYKDILNRIWTIGTGKSAEDITPNRSLHSEKYYKGIISMPYRKTSAAYVDAISGQGPRERVSNIEDVQRNLRHSSNMPLTINGNADLLKKNNGN